MRTYHSSSPTAYMSASLLNLDPHFCKSWKSKSPSLMDDCRELRDPASDPSPSWANTSMESYGTTQWPSSAVHRFYRNTESNMLHMHVTHDDGNSVVDMFLDLLLVQPLYFFCCFRANKYVELAEIMGTLINIYTHKHSYYTYFINEVSNIFFLFWMLPIFCRRGNMLPIAGRRGNICRGNV